MYSSHTCDRIGCQDCSSSQERVEAEGMDYAEFLKKMKKDKRHLASWDILGWQNDTMSVDSWDLQDIGWSLGKFGVSSVYIIYLSIYLSIYIKSISGLYLYFWNKWIDKHIRTREREREIDAFYNIIWYDIMWYNIVYNVLQYDVI